MKIYLLLRLIMMSLIVVILSRCGTNNGMNYIDPTFQTMYNNFIIAANAFGLKLDSNQSLTIQFSTLNETNSLGEVVGECNSIGYGGGTILVDRSYWNTTTDTMQQILLYHELGHCVLGEYHTSDMSNIMNPLLNNPEIYLSDGGDWSILQNKLFGQKGQ